LPDRSGGQTDGRCESVTYDGVMTSASRRPAQTVECPLTALGSKEAEMRIIGCDLHASQQSIAMLDQDTGETLDVTLKHEGTTVRDFYAALPRPVVVGIEATGSMRMVRDVDGGIRDYVPRGSSGDDSRGGAAAPETRPPRRGAVARSARRRSLSCDLAAIERTARPPCAIAAPA
jgi:hypothetical protein